MQNSSIDEAAMKSFVEEVMKLQRRYAHEKRNIVTERRSKLREIIDRFAPGAPDGPSTAKGKPEGGLKLEDL